MSVHVLETFESRPIAILADNFCTGVENGHAESTAEILPLD